MTASAADDEQVAALLGGGAPPVLVRLATGPPVQKLLDAAARAGWRADRLELGGAADPAELMAQCARELGLPHWFGRNLDALYDCLTDPDWLGPSRRLLALTGWQGYAHAQPVHWARFLDVLADAADYWGSTPTPLLPLLLPQ